MNILYSTRGKVNWSIQDLIIAIIRSIVGRSHIGKPSQIDSYYTIYIVSQNKYKALNCALNDVLSLAARSLSKSIASIVTKYCKNVLEYEVSFTSMFIIGDHILPNLTRYKINWPNPKSQC